MEEATKLGIRGTPTFLIGTAAPGEATVTITKAIVGAEELDAFKSAVDPLLAPVQPAAAVTQLDTDSRTAGAP